MEKTRHGESIGVLVVVLLMALIGSQPEIDAEADCLDGDEVEWK